VTFIGERLSQFCREDAAAAEGWITNNSYPHMYD
jgi:hypothetical protein